MPQTSGAILLILLHSLSLSWALWPPSWILANNNGQQPFRPMQQQQQINAEQQLQQLALEEQQQQQQHEPKLLEVRDVGAGEMEPVNIGRQQEM